MLENRAFTSNKMLTTDKIRPCAPAHAEEVKKSWQKVWRDGKKGLPLQRYPENNLFTLEN